MHVENRPAIGGSRTLEQVVVVPLDKHRRDYLYLVDDMSTKGILTKSSESDEQELYIETTWVVATSGWRMDTGGNLCDRGRWSITALPTRVSRQQHLVAGKLAVHQQEPM